MKKLVALFMMILMILNICACKRMPENTDGISLPAASGEEKTEDKGTGALSPTPPVGQEDTAPKNPEEDEDKAEDKTSTDTPDTEKDFTFDVPFSEYEVIVTLTDEESAKNKIYTPDDFPELDVFNVFENPEYYTCKFIEDNYKYQNNNEYKNKTTLILMLSDPSRERVLEYIKILRKDKRVFEVWPNIDEFCTYDFWIKLKNGYEYTDELISKLNLDKCKVKKVNFSSEDSGLVRNAVYGIYDDGFVTVKVDYSEFVQHDKKEICLILKELMSHPEVLCVIPDYENGKVYGYRCIEVELSNTDKKTDQYSKADFSKLDLKKIERVSSSYIYKNKLFIYLKSIDVEYAFEMYNVLSKDNRFKNVSFEVVDFGKLL